MKIEERLEKSGRFEAVSVSFATGTILIRSPRALDFEDLTFVQQVCEMCIRDSSSGPRQLW